MLNRIDRFIDRVLEIDPLRDINSFEDGQAYRKIHSMYRRMITGLIILVSIALYLAIAVYLP